MKLFLTSGLHVVSYNPLESRQHENLTLMQHEVHRQGNGTSWGALQAQFELEQKSKQKLTIKTEQQNQHKRITFKLKEAAQLMGVSEISIRRAIEKGQLRPCRAFRHILIPASELEKLIGVNGTK